MIWLQISTGRGPGECQQAIAPLASMVVKEAKALGIDAFCLEGEQGPHGLMSAIVSFGDVPTDFLATWVGTIQWICPSSIRPDHRRKNWFIGVTSIEPPIAAGQAIIDKDLRFDTYRAGGAGGQHVNKTDSAVRVTHIPTGTVAQAQEERSQYFNRALAVARLYEALRDQAAVAEKATERRLRDQHDKVERGNPVRTYRGPDFQRVA